jgi:hypothetical protein
VLPSEIHQRVPTFLGSIENVYELDQFFQYYGDADNEETEEAGHDDDDNKNDRYEAILLPKDIV